MQNAAPGGGALLGHGRGLRQDTPFFVLKSCRGMSRIGKQLRLMNERAKGSVKKEETKP
jgi:hypothetical protein